jgi:flavin reductase (DIM6/NTAB) family NADH-FMN oxidoreductase RutF
MGTLARMATKDGPIGPYPGSVETDDAKVEYDKLRRRVLWTMPSGLYVVGSTDGGQRRNGMTINWVTQLSFEPKLLGISVERDAFTHELIEAGEVFSVCLISREDRSIVRKFTKPVEVDLEGKTLNGFPYVERATGAPILAQAVAYLDCEVRDRLVAGNHSFFVGEIVDAAFLAAEDTPVLRMDDTRMNYGG